jgi:transposase
MERNLYVGCDVSKDTFHYCVRNREGILLQGEVENSKKSVNKWIVQLNKHYGLERLIFCLEHTGIYVAIICRELHKLEALICLEGAMQIKNSLGLTRGKNDRIDASRIAEYAMRFTDRLIRWTPRRQVVEQLDSLCAMRRRLIKARNLIKVPIQESERFNDKEVHKLMKNNACNSLDGINEDLKAIEAQIKDLFAQDSSLKKLKSQVTSVTGVGMVTCCELIIKTNEFKAFSNGKKLACMVGVAPFEHTSGSSIRGKTRVSPKADKSLKTLLHMCALAAISTEGEMRTYFDRQIAKGKHKMVALNAVRNKLVHRIFAVVRDNTTYQKNYQYKVA